MENETPSAITGDSSSLPQQARSVETTTVEEHLQSNAPAVAVDVAVDDTTAVPEAQQDARSSPQTSLTMSSSRAAAAVAKNHRTWYHSDGNPTTPGAVAVRGTQSTTTSWPIELADPNESDRDQGEAEATSIMMVEATAVDEIIAEQVILEPSSSVAPHPHPQSSPAPSSFHHNSPLDDITIQHVDIDNFDTDDPEHAPVAGGVQAPQQAKDLSQSSPSHSYLIIALCVSSVILVFILVGFIISELYIPEMDGIDQDSLTDCRLAQEETLVRLEQLEGIAYLEFAVSWGVIGTIIYQLLDTCQDRYCAASENPDNPPGHTPLYYNLILVTMESLWLLVTLGIMIWMEMQALREPLQTIKTKCENNNVEWDVAVGDLNAYYLAACLRLPQIIFLLIARGRLLFNSRSCQHISRFWRHFWFWFKIVMEVELFLLVACTLFFYVRPVIDDMTGLEVE